MNLPTTPSTSLGGVLRCVRDIFTAINHDAKLYIGEEYLPQTDAPRRVVFVPAKDAGSWGDQPTGTGGTGHVGGVALGCAVYVWGNRSPDGDPWARYDDADALADDVFNALKRAAPGRIDGGDFRDPSPSTDDNYGQQYKIVFTYTRGIQKNARIFALRNSTNPAIDPVSPPDPSKPPGSPPSTVVVDVTTNLS